MKVLTFNIFLLIGAVFIISAACPIPVLAINRIEGTVYSPDRRPVNDVRVELQSDVGSLLNTAKTRSGGRFTFVGVAAGRFLIKVIPMGLGFLEETTYVEVLNFGRTNSSDTEYVDIYLKYDKRAQKETQNRSTEVVFAQDVPERARKLYESGVDSLKKNPEKGIVDLKEALAIFPAYFDALTALGNEYIARKDYANAYPFFLQAIDINPRSFTSYYNLSVSFYQLNEIKAALPAAKAATMLSPSYVDALVLYGVLLRLSEDYKEAMAELVKANSLSNNQNPEAHWQLALVFNKLNRNEEAAKELELYIKTNPNSAENKKTQELIGKLRGKN
jgi:tetratricopeptide (TPR) repeat protein